MAHIFVRTLTLCPAIICYKQWHLGSGHSIIKQSIRKNVLFQVYFLDNLKPKFEASLNFANWWTKKKLIHISTTRKMKYTMTGVEPGPQARKPFMISARPGDLFWNSMQFIGLMMCMAYTQWTVHRTVHHKKSSCFIFSTKLTTILDWVCDIQASLILTSYFLEEFKHIKGIFQRFTVVK